MYVFKCGDDSKTKTKRFSKLYSKNIIFEENKKCLDSKKNNEECDNFLLRSVNHDMYLQQIKKISLSFFDDKRNYLCNI